MTREERARTVRSLAWALVGALMVAGLAAAFTPLVVLTLAALGLAAVLMASDGLDRRAWTALAGASWMPLWMAWINRADGAEVCTVSGTESTCTSSASPWLWLAVGLVLLVVGVALSLRAPGAHRSRPERAPTEDAARLG